MWVSTKPLTLEQIYQYEFLLNASVFYAKFSQSVASICLS